MLYLGFDRDGYFEAVLYSREEKPGVPGVEALEELCVPEAWLHAYRWDGEKLVPDEAKLAKIKAEEKRKEDDLKIDNLKNKLLETDYVVIKIAEGVATKEEYADIIAQRQTWRSEINELENDNMEVY